MLYVKKDSSQDKVTSRPLISLISVVFNGAENIENTILSVINQNYENYEYIIIDGGSEDSTLDVIKKYESKIDFWISEHDNGAYDAMNKGIDSATGKWIIFLGADDYLMPNILLKTSSLLANEKAIYYGDAYMPKRHQIYDGKFNQYKLSLRNICHQAIFYPSQILKQNKFNLEYRIHSDYELNLRLYKNYKFIYLPLLVAVYNDYSGLSKENKDNLFHKEKPKFIYSSMNIWVFTLFYLRRIFAALLKLLKLKK